MRITQQLFEIIQEKLPQLFVRGEATAALSTQFAEFLPSAALAGGDAVWGQVSNRAVPPERKLIVISPNQLKQASYDELRAINIMACFCQRAGFTVLVPIGDELEEYGMQLFDRQKIAKTRHYTAAALYQLSYEKTQKSANQIFLVDDGSIVDVRTVIKLQSYQPRSADDVYVDTIYPDQVFFASAGQVELDNFSLFSESPPLSQETLPIEGFLSPEDLLIFKHLATFAQNYLDRYKDFFLPLIARGVSIRILFSVMQKSDWSGIRADKHNKLISILDTCHYAATDDFLSDLEAGKNKSYLEDDSDWFFTKLMTELMRNRWRDRQRSDGVLQSGRVHRDHLYHLVINYRVSREEARFLGEYTKQIQVLVKKSTDPVFLEESTDFSSLQLLSCYWSGGRLAINAPLLREMNVVLYESRVFYGSEEQREGERWTISLKGKPYLSSLSIDIGFCSLSASRRICIESSINPNLTVMQVRGILSDIDWLSSLIDSSPSLRELNLSVVDFKCRGEIEKLKKRFPLLEVTILGYCNRPVDLSQEDGCANDDSDGVYQTAVSRQGRKDGVTNPLFACVEPLLNWEPFKKIKDAGTGKLIVYPTKEAVLEATGSFRFHEGIYEKYEIMLGVQDLVFSLTLLEIKNKSQLYKKYIDLKAVLENAKKRLEDLCQDYNHGGFFKTQKKFYASVIRSIAVAEQEILALRHSLAAGVLPDEKDEQLVYAGEPALALDFDTRHDPKIEYVMTVVCRHVTKGRPNRFPHTRLGVYALNARRELEEMRGLSVMPYSLAVNPETLPADEYHDFYVFQDAITLGEGQVYRLNSLSARDELFQLKLDGKSLTESDVEIAKDSLGFFYIKTKCTLSGKLQYVMNVPLSTLQEAIDLPRALNEIVTHIRSFPSSGSESLAGVAESASSEEKWEAMYREKKGACRHRAAIFLYKLNQLALENPEKYRDIKARAVTRGGAHVNVELSLDCGITYEVLELGGYEARQRYVSTENTVYDLPFVLPPICFSARQERNKDQPKVPFLERVGWINSSASQGANTLFCIDAIKEIDHCLFYLRAHSQRPIFYVESPLQLRTELKNFKLLPDHKTCDIQGSPSGLLYRFLMQHQESEPPPIIIINWENFEFDEIVQCNSVIDIRHRLVDNTALPLGATVIGFHSRQGKLNDLLQDASFVSRHVKGGIHDISEIPALEFESGAAQAAAAEVIQLHQSSRWYDLLVGKVVLRGGGYEWQEGALLKKLRDPRVTEIELVNPPLDDAGFLHFVAELRAGQPIPMLDFIVPGRPLTIRVVENPTFPPDVALTLRRCQQLPRDVFVINAATFEQCLHSKEVTHDGLMFSRMGLLEKYQNQTLGLCVSGNLSYSQWSLLLAYAKEYRVTLDLSLTEEVVLPSQLKITDTGVAVEETISPNLFIASDDVEFSVLKQQRVHEDAIVIDLSELGIDDLFGKILPPKQTHAGFIFEKQGMHVLDALIRGDTVILKGYCSPEMMNYLATLFSPAPYFMVDGERCPLPGKLIIVAENTVKTPGWLGVRKEEIQASEKLAELSLSAVDGCEKKSFIQLQQDQKIKQAPVLVVPPLPSDDDFSLSACIAFEERRMISVKQVWSFSPVAVLEGPPAAGKSHFVRELKKDPNIKIYYENDIEKWATEIVPPHIKKVLFRDEINLRKTDCSQDRDLFNYPASVFVNGKYIRTVGDCCVLSAQNPSDYGGGRREPQLFRDLPACKVKFDSMSPAMIVHRVLKPIFQTLYDPDQSELLAKKLFIENQSVRTVRDLQNKAVAVCAAEAERRWAVANHIDVFVRPKNPRIICLGRAEFIVTPSRYPAYHDLLDLLNIRKFKQSLLDTAPDEAKYGGVNGLILRGPAGVGKSEFIESVLKEEGYRKGDIDVADFMSGGDKSYFRLSAKKIASMTNDEIKWLMGKAFHAGVILLIDEIDSCRLLEKYLNAYLTGEDVDGKRPLKTGFTVLCTGNGAAMKGRRQLPQPLLSRMSVHEFSEYSREELIDLLSVKFVSPVTSGAASVTEAIRDHQLKAEMIAFMVDGFLSEKKKNTAVPATFRELCAVAESYFEQFSRYSSLNLTRAQHEFVLVYRNHPRVEFLLREIELRSGFKNLSVAEMEKQLLKEASLSGGLFGAAGEREVVDPIDQKGRGFLKRL